MGQAGKGPPAGRGKRARQASSRRLAGAYAPPCVMGASASADQSRIPSYTRGADEQRSEEVEYMCRRAWWTELSRGQRSRVVGIEITTCYYAFESRGAEEAYSTHACFHSRDCQGHGLTLTCKTHNTYSESRSW